MELMDAVLKRRMVRNFANTPVDPQKIERIVELTRPHPAQASRRGNLSS